MQHHNAACRAGFDLYYLGLLGVTQLSQTCLLSPSGLT